MSQLDLYYSFVKEYYEDFNGHFFILSPFYNVFYEKYLEKDEFKYTRISYDDLLTFFSKYGGEKPQYYEEFLHALEIQTIPVDEYHYELMMRKFNEILEQKK